MKRITLDEAYANAAHRPLHSGHDGDEVQIGDKDGFVAMTLPCNSSGAIYRDYVNAALLKHSFNHFGNVVELCEDLLDYISEDESNRAIGLRRDAVNILLEASTVEVPE